MTKIELSPRETEVLLLVANGKSYKKIARIMTLSLPTIKFHMGRAREKLGAENSSHAVALFMKCHPEDRHTLG